MGGIENRNTGQTKHNGRYLSRKEMQGLVVQGEIYVVEDRPNPVFWKYNFDSNLWNSFPAFD